VTANDVRAAVVEALGRIAPEVDSASIDPVRSLRDELDLDSMDFLNLVQSLHRRLGVDIPEADYAQLQTLDGAVAYLTAKMATIAP
jgi:acyl carrier protein